LAKNGRDDPALEAVPKDFDSIVGMGRTEPDPAKEALMKSDGRDVELSQGKPIKSKCFPFSSFSQSEYVVKTMSSA